MWLSRGQANPEIGARTTHARRDEGKPVLRTDRHSGPARRGLTRVAATWLPNAGPLLSLTPFLRRGAYAEISLGCMCAGAREPLSGWIRAARATGSTPVSVRTRRLDFC